ncbi:MAG: hypothetical protein LBF32_01655 [Streptococcaceae bacterium]|jgi:hypothetical protein|nr:hypothetical protein [Streptococcaceae bacterium]
MLGAGKNNLKVINDVEHVTWVSLLYKAMVAIAHEADFNFLDLGKRKDKYRSGVGYIKAYGGHSKDVLQLLTGKKYCEWDNKSSLSAFKHLNPDGEERDYALSDSKAIDVQCGFIEKSLKSEVPVTATVLRKNFEFNGMKFSAPHAYSITKVKHEKDGKRYIGITNPHMERPKGYKEHGDESNPGFTWLETGIENDEFHEIFDHIGFSEEVIEKQFGGNCRINLWGYGII